MLLQGDVDELKLELSSLDARLEEMRNKRLQYFDKINELLTNIDTLEHTDNLAMITECFKNHLDNLRELAVLNDVCINNISLLKSVLSYLLERDANVSIIEYIKRNR